MPEYSAMREVLGKTIQGVIVKENERGGFPAMAVHLVFTDGTSYEIYSDVRMNFAGGLNHWDMEHTRRYASPPMNNVLDVALDHDSP